MKKILIICFMLVIPFALVGCNKEDNKSISYNAVMMDCGPINVAQHYNYFKDSFLLENKIRFVYYKNEYYDPSDPESEEYILDTTSPEKIILEIESLEKLEQVFNKNYEINFDKEVLILYLFLNTNCSYSLNKVELKNNILEITYNWKINITTNPERTFILIKLDKIEYENIEFIGKRKA